MFANPRSDPPHMVSTVKQCSQIPVQILEKPHTNVPTKAVSPAPLTSDEAVNAHSMVDIVLHRDAGCPERKAPTFGGRGIHVGAECFPPVKLMNTLLDKRARCSMYTWGKHSAKTGAYRHSQNTLSSLVFHCEKSSKVDGERWLTFGNLIPCSKQSRSLHMCSQWPGFVLMLYIKKTNVASSWRHPVEHSHNYSLLLPHE